MINLKVSDLEVKVNQIEPRVTEVENSCSFISHENDDRKRELDRAKAEVDRLRSECISMQCDTNTLKEKNASLESKVIDLESRSMRDNLLFYGICEKGQQENCEESVKDVCYDYLDMQDAGDLKFDRVHRVGTFSKNRVRPIVAKFHYFKDRETVRQRAYQYNAELKERNLGVCQQWPAEVRKTRKALFPIMQREKSHGKQVKLVKDKLYVNDVEYKLTQQERHSQQNASQGPRYTPGPPPSYPPWTINQNNGPPAQFGYMQQQNSPRQWVPPPPPVPPGHPGAYRWRSPTGMAPVMQQTSKLPNLPPIVHQQPYQQPMTSQQSRPPTPTPPTRQPTPTPQTGHPTPVQQQNQQIRQGPVQSSGQETPAPQEMQHDGQ